MGKWTKTAGLLFLAAASVYSTQAIVAAVGSGAKVTASASTVQVAKVTESTAVLAAPEPTTDVKILEDNTDPFAASGPTTAPSAKGASATTQPTEGRSVSSSEVSVNDAGTVEIHVNDANLVEVLRMLSLQSQKNIVASKDVHGTVTANLYDVTVREALDAILHANGYAYREKGNFIYVYTAKEIADIEKAERQMRTEVFRTYYVNAANAANMIKPVLSKAGGEVAVTTPAKAGIASAPSGGGGDEHAGNDILVVTDYPENLDAVKKVLADIDRRPQQILLEATILRAQLNEDNALGVDFNILGGVDFNAIQMGETNGQITGAGVRPTPAPKDALDQTESIKTDGRAHAVGTGNSFTSPIQGGLKVGYLTNSVSIFVSALEQTTDTTILANPKVLALNKEQGEVFVGNEDGYYTTLTTETTTSQSVESLKTGTRLIFRPFIANDGYIRMEVHPEDSDGQVKSNGLPSKSTTEVTSNIMVKDGHTIVIGGLFRESTVSGRNQVPFLGNLPVAGLLFRNQHDRTVREEVIILLTPHVIKDDSMMSRLSEEQLKHAEDLRVGVRKGLMPWGRERMAEGWYESAKKELAKPKPNRSAAKFDLDCATNLNPNFSEAIELKEQITGHEITTSDGSSIRGYLRRAMLVDVVPTTMPAATQPTVSAAATTKPSEATANSLQTSDPLANSATTQPSSDSSTAMTGDDESGTESAEGTLAPAMVGTAEASTDEDHPAVPATPASTEPTSKPAATQASTDENTDPLATTPATGEATVTIVTPIEGDESDHADASKGNETPSTQPTAHADVDPLDQSNSSSNSSEGNESSESSSQQEQK